MTIHTVQDWDQPVDVASWPFDDEFGEVYREGSRVKSRRYCLTPAPYGFLLEGHPYLFKHSSHRYPEQFYVEVFAHRLGILLEVPVPPAFVSFNSQTDVCAALIEWFYDYSGDGNGPETYISGGNYMRRLIPKYDLKTGAQHSFDAIEAWMRVLRLNKVLVGDWVEYWAKTFLFDALIGNTDRHQDNWGLIWDQRRPVKLSWTARVLGKILGQPPHAWSRHARLAPVFDNGTSMGHEIAMSKFTQLLKPDRMERYVDSGVHHMKWEHSDSSRLSHNDFLKRYLKSFPRTRDVMFQCLQVDMGQVWDILENLTRFEVPIRLSVERAEFMFDLLTYRRERLLAVLEASG